MPFLRQPRPASRFQRKRSPVRAIAERARPKIAKAIASALKTFRARVPIKAIEADIRARNFRGASERVDTDALATLLRTAFLSIAEAYHEAARYGEGRVNADAAAARKRKVRKAPPKPAPDQFAFDLFSEDVLSDLQEWQSALIQNLTADAQQQIYDAIIAGVRNGQEPEDVAASIKDVIGLTDRQAVAVENYRAALEAGDTSALDRALRDAGADSDVLAAFDAGVPLGQDVIDDLVNAYAENSLDFRAQTIALTESSRAANSGLQDAYSQAIDRGVFPDEAVRQFWMIAAGDRDEDECDECADNAEDGIAIGETFTCSEGDFDSPPAHPRCACDIEIRTDLDMAAAANASQEEAQEAA